ncbi:hypothetical protein F7725_000714 [Dissostichus mawsoni]|uniref:Uncharacterized protein n=1 Tax=Dissostichus mawsoni TaxID=36200 RepID=A0A7J5ZHJ2_DISMA|nr:hypothetical protein F7725_000714 [Dissostichus mawsoni]
MLVFMSSLMSLFTHCPMCKENSPGRLRRTMGTFVEIDQNCKHCGFQRSWQNQPFIDKTPAGNLLLSAGILFAGTSPTKVLRVLKSINCYTITTRTFLNHQKKFLQPAIKNNEVPSSVHMEKEGLVRCVQFLESENLVMKTL